MMVKSDMEAGWSGSSSAAPQSELTNDSCTFFMSKERAAEAAGAQKSEHTTRSMHRKPSDLEGQSTMLLVSFGSLSVYCVRSSSCGRERERVCVCVMRRRR
ncbi:hypothetical protein KP509_01G050800 [Ceratopteris richardii]|uniref:Uncharacterized protein n=1 Tax=Ceratopteris richardii TaxID=49495 RepID=A0A8T2VL31_CERRI|nr:hypothetical protein KP509_01G050800 [Ceratopteris richardii]